MPCGCGLFDISDNFAGTPAKQIYQMLIASTTGKFPRLSFTPYLSFLPSLTHKELFCLKQFFSLFLQVGI